MKLDPQKVFERWVEDGGSAGSDVLAVRASAIIKAICDEFNAELEQALYSTEPSALERLGTMIAEHALGRVELVRCRSADGHTGACDPGPVAPGSSSDGRCRLDGYHPGGDAARFAMSAGGKLIYVDPDGGRREHDVVPGRDGTSVTLVFRRYTAGEPARRRDDPEPSVATGLPSIRRVEVQLENHRIAWLPGVQNTEAAVRLSAYAYGRGWREMSNEIIRATDSRVGVRIPWDVSSELTSDGTAPIMLRFDIEGEPSALLTIRGY